MFRDKKLGHERIMSIPPNNEADSDEKFHVGSVQTGVGFSPPRSVNLPFCHLGLLKGRFSSL